MDFREYVENNQTVVQFVKDYMPGENDKYIGTLDYATARFNTILLRLSEDPLMADQYKIDVQECYQIIHNFYRNFKWFTTANSFLRPFLKLILHYQGTIHIPKIKLLLEKINN
tara:strand:+ start:311 stop:649 length:339 start_codon:yes stop_codon:yes gene_type:complete